MTIPDYLLRAVLEAPEDDAPRLAFADWLEEQGETERAEFIRVQVELAIIVERFRSCQWVPPAGTARKRLTLMRRERELLEANAVDWTLRLADAESLVVEKGSASVVQYGTMPPMSAQMVFRRGFVHAITCTAADWLAHADALTWRPGEKCRSCMGGGGGGPSVSGMMRSFALGAVDCPACRGTGLRPCPETAQPIREVRLTTLPATHPFLYLDRDCQKAQLEMWWPGVRFHLPALSRRGTVVWEGIHERLPATGFIITTTDHT